MGNTLADVHTQTSVLVREHSPNALHASSCKTDWLRGWCHTQRRCRRIHTFALLLFPFNKYHRHTSGRVVPRLVTHRDDDDTVPRDSSRASRFTSWPPWAKPQRWWRVNIVIARVITRAMRWRLTCEQSRSQNPVANECRARCTFSTSACVVFSQRHRTGETNVDLQIKTFKSL